MVHGPPAGGCTHVFVDVGANVGDSLVKWFSQPNCYQNCFERNLPNNPENCLPSNETCGRTGDCSNINQTCFCHKQAKQSRCGWEWPYWFPLGVRQQYCAEAFEPNHLLARKLRQQAHMLERNGKAPYIRVHNGTALAMADGTATFGLDLNHTTGSSLVLDKKTMGAGGKVGAGVAVGENTVTVQTWDAVRYLRALSAPHVSLKLDVEGTEFEMLRDLLVSGVLCEKVDNLWIEWHGGGRINWKSLNLPMQEAQMQKMYTWLLSTVQSRRITTRQDLSPHCRTFLGRWA